MNEQQFETELIQYLSSGVISHRGNHSDGGNTLAEPAADYIYKTKRWRHHPEIKTTDDLLKPSEINKQGGVRYLG